MITLVIRPLSMIGEGFRVPLFEQLFSKLNIYKTPCPEGVCRRRYHSVNQPDISDKQTESRIVTLDLGSPLRGRTALRVQSSYKEVNQSLGFQIFRFHIILISSKNYLTSIFFLPRIFEINEFCNFVP